MVAIIFPWAIIFADDNPLGGFIALALQATLIGWIPAAVWAWKIVHRPIEGEEIVHANPSIETVAQKSESNANNKVTK